MIRKLLGWVALVFVLAGCAESVEPDPLYMGYQYYPLEVGDYRVYHVTKVRIQFDKKDTTRYLMRELVKSSFEDQTGKLNYRIERSLRPNNKSQWIADSVFVVSKTETNVVLTADNTKRVKLIFPVRNGNSWKGDAFNDYGDFEDIGQEEAKENYIYTAVGETFTLDEQNLIYNNTALHFDTTTTVIQGVYTEDLTSIDRRKEVYASGVGKIYRLFNRVLLCTASDDSTCDNYMVDGNERHEVLIEYGKL